MGQTNQDQPKHFQFMGLTFPWKPKQLLATALKVWLVMLIVLLVSTLVFGYEMTDADIPGGLVFGILLAYLLNLILE